MFKNLMFICFLLIGFVFISYCYGDVPNEIRYNGKLKEYKVAANGTKQMNFKFYSEETGGTAIWESGTQSVKVSSGMFTYIIRPDNPKVDWRNKDIYLEIVIDGNTLSPREKLLSVPYSLHSQLSQHSQTAENILIVEGKEFSVTIGDKQKFSVNKDNVKFTDENNIEFYMVPKGAIVIWSGSVDKIPAGWALCDGSEGTPDLRNKFVLGSGDKYSVGQSGGEEEHTLTVNEMPSHSHEISRTFSGGGGGSSGGDINTSGTGNTPFHILSTGGNKPHNNMPPYYSLCYIMKK